jgi:AGCS family alanine or glycine:cation symporter
MYYLKDGLGSKKGCKQIGAVLAVLFSIFCVIASFGIGNMSQINSIAVNLNSVFNLSYLGTGIILMMLAGFVIVGGLKRIASVTEKLVPVMAVLYVIGCVVIVVSNINMVGPAFTAIITGAFAMKAVGGGIVGSGVKVAITWGMKRGVFSNEAGLGSSVMVHSNSDVKEPVKQGMWGIFEVFADTFVVCTMTALVVLTSGFIDLDTGLAKEGVEDATLVAKAFSSIFGIGGEWFIAIAILLFAFTTVLGWSHYGSKAVEYLINEKAVIAFRIVFVIFMIVGALSTSSLAWDISDTFNGMMMIPNLIGVLSLAPLVHKITTNYINRKIKGRDEKPLLSYFPDIQEEQEKKVLEGEE